MLDKNVYENPLIKRYSSDEMKKIFSPNEKFKTWRKLWVALAEGEKELGLPIKQSQINELKKYIDNINYKVAEKKEKEIRHDVMSHIYAFSKQAKSAGGIIHLGATSAFVGDNTDLIVQKKALEIISNKLLILMKNLSKLALKYKELPMLGFTHLQPAQLTTLGKRISLWLYEFYLDYIWISDLPKDLPFLGVKGTTGTMASFLALFNGDEKKCFELEKLIAKKMGFTEIVSVSGQTYSRKIDSMTLSILKGIAESASKMTNDIRILQSLKEIEEPFESSQIGSSAMPYKRNPMRSERVSSLAKYIMNVSNTLSSISSTQWFERTLDDSAARRIVIPETFLATDAVLDILRNITENLVVYPKIIHSHIMSEIPFMATENILMEAVKRGGNRQKLHEKIRRYSMFAGKEVKENGKENDLLLRITNDKAFNLKKTDLEKLTNPKLYIGLSQKQVENFIKKNINPLLKKIKNENEVILKV
ncbi:MAG: adenylosuccinate lyase [Clostridiales Family XIII bacterium]|jgi:adenylosuccinate lyase|nr:adenylosuccinate lyase [Clostridiales Family XIII bacterium]